MILSVHFRMLIFLVCEGGPIGKNYMVVADFVYAA